MEITETIPNSACQLRAAPVGEVSVDDASFTLSAYKLGQKVAHPYWGEFVFETSSLKMAKSKIPVTVDHSTSRGCGYATEMKIEDGVVNFPGNFVENEHSEYVKSFKGTDMFQCSLQFDPMVTEFQWIDDNELVEVDGVEHKGPMVVFKNAEVIEVAFTLLPAVPDTSSSFSQPSFSKEKVMAEDKAKDAESRKLGHAESIAKFNRMNAMCENKVLVSTCFAQDMSLEDFSVEVTKDLKASNAQLSADLESKNQELEAVKAELAQFKKGSEGVSPVPGSGGDASAEPKGFMDKVSKFAADNNLTQGAAFKKMIVSDPEGYREYRKELLGGE